MNSFCVNVMQILLQLFQVLFLGNIVPARQIKLQTNREHLRILALLHMIKEKKKKKHYKAKIFPITVKLIESNTREIGVYTLLLSFL